LYNTGNRKIIKYFYSTWNGPTFPSGVSLVEAKTRWKKEPFLAAAPGSAAEEPTAAPSPAEEESAAAEKPAATNGDKRGFSGEGETAVKSNRHKPKKNGNKAKITLGKKTKKALGKEAKQVGSKKAAHGMGEKNNKHEKAKKQTKGKGIRAKKQKKGGKTGNKRKTQKKQKGKGVKAKKQNKGGKTGNKRKTQKKQKGKTVEGKAKKKSMKHGKTSTEHRAQNDSCITVSYHYYFYHACHLWFLHVSILFFR
jgi:hypothetical protein